MIKHIEVIARMSPDSFPMPIKIIWEDGRILEIDKVIETRKKASTKGGGAGLRYLIKIHGHERYIFLKDYSWFIEL